MEIEHILQDQPADPALDGFVVDAHTIICKWQRGTLIEHDMLQFGMRCLVNSLRASPPERAQRLSLTIINALVKAVDEQKKAALKTA
jgi:hypothetical protein